MRNKCPEFSFIFQKNDFFFNPPFEREKYEKTLGIKWNEWMNEWETKEKQRNENFLDYQNNNLWYVEKSSRAFKNNNNNDHLMNMEYGYIVV